MSEHLCEAINHFDKDITLKANDSKLIIDLNKIQKEYCTSENGKRECYSYEVIVSSVFIILLKFFMSRDDLKNNKLAEYTISWLCYKLNQKEENGITNLDDFHNKYIKENKKDIEKIAGIEGYNSYNDIINNKIDLKTIDIKEMSKLYLPLKSLCNMYTEFDTKNNNCTKCSKDAKEFVEKYNEINEDPIITGNNSYRKILFTLFNDYNIFKSYRAKKCSACNNVSTLTDISPPQSPIENFLEASEATLSSSSIASKLIPALLIFAIPVFLGIAYK
ncbi:Plasmodium variant antigen protein Cir/Yir/Bir, putative, partial [Plasmodium chabaudi adami]